MKILGIDEAGRGPVIGPMIMAGVMLNEKDLHFVKEAKDSKLLNHKQRIDLDKKIKENAKYKILIISPKIIDSAILSKELNLNWLEAHKQAEIINYLKPDKAIIDCPSVNIISYKNYLQALIKNKNIKLIVEHKADFNYPICSAASILAKVERENQMDKIKQKYGNCGPGYPSNKTTQEFIKKNWDEYPEIFRKTWSTFKRIQNSKNQTKLFKFS